jgi:hypothetical protein
MIPYMMNSSEVHFRRKVSGRVINIANLKFRL